MGNANEEPKCGEGKKGNAWKQRRGLRGDHLGQRLEGRAGLARQENLEGLYTDRIQTLG